LFIYVLFNGCGFSTYTVLQHRDICKIKVLFILINDKCIILVAKPHERRPSGDHNEPGRNILKYILGKQVGKM
jgi:hypothetical protein